jgi:hypothetical protein
MGHAVWKIFDSSIPVGILVIYIGMPIVALWGCIRWYKAKTPQSVPAWLSCVGFWLAITSGGLAVSSVAYALKTGGLAYYLPSFFRIVAWGFWIAAIAVLLSLAGIWRRSPLRWHAAFCALAMLFYWSTAVFE